MYGAQQLSWTRRMAWCYTTADCGSQTGGDIRFRNENRSAFLPASL
jgi:hypothetical protein